MRISSVRIGRRSNDSALDTCASVNTNDPQALVPAIGYHGDRREGGRSSICRLGVHRVPSGSVFGLQLSHNSGRSARSVTAGPTARTPESGSFHAKAAIVGSGADARRPRQRIRRLRVDC